MPTTLSIEVEMQPETRFKMRIYGRLRVIKKSYWEKLSERSIRGIHDIKGCVRGRYVSIELKVNGNKLDPLQRYRAEKITEADGLFFEMTPDNFEDIIEELESLPMSLDYDEGADDSEE